MRFAGKAMQSSITASVDVRFTFTGQFLEAATLFARRAKEIEAGPIEVLTDALRSEHRGLITACIMQSAAALETEAHEICAFGPGSYLGSNGIIHSARQFLAPLIDFVDDQRTLDRFDLILHLLQRPALDKGREPYQSASLLVRLRNEITHYKSKWGEEMASQKLFTSLKALHHKPPAFVSETSNFFPHQCLSADCAAWAVRSTVAFLDAVYVSLGVPSRFDTYRPRVTP